MIQLTILMWGMALVFAYIGYSRGWNKEIIATAGIVLGLFALFEFDDVLDELFLNVPPEQSFLARAVIFVVIVYFAYQTRALIGEDATRARSRGDGRDELQTSVLGGIVGFVNGYLIWGSLWFFLDDTGYPLSPYITAPVPGSPSADFLSSLPLAILGSGGGNLLAAVVIVLFLIVLIVI